MGGFVRVAYLWGIIMPKYVFTSEFFYLDPAYNVIASCSSGTVTAMSQLSQGIGTYLQKEDGKLKAFSGGIEMYAVDIENAEDVVLLARAFCEFCGVNHTRAKQQLQSLVTAYIS